MRPLGLTAALRYGLTIWLLATSTAPAVCHEHAGGEELHSHGLGLFGTGPTTQAGDAAPGETAPGCRHFHLILFGFELNVSPHNGVLAPQGHFPDQRDAGNLLRLTGDLVDGVCTAADTTAQPDAFLSPEPVTSALPGDLPALVRTPAVPAASTPLCDLARGLCAGAQRI